MDSNFYYEIMQRYYFQNMYNFIFFKNIYVTFNFDIEIIGFFYSKLNLRKERIDTRFLFS